MTASTEPPVPSASSSTASLPNRSHAGAPWSRCGPLPPGVVTPPMPWGAPRSARPSMRHRPLLRVGDSGSGRMPREPLDAPENLPEKSPCQVAFGQLQDEVPGMPDEAFAHVANAARPVECAILRVRKGGFGCPRRDGESSTTG